MALSVFTSVATIAENSRATPGLWNNIFSIISQNVDQLNSDTSVVPPTRGGTGQSTVVLGDVLYGSAADVWSRLAGQTTTARRFLRQTGTGALSAAPVWDTIVAADVPGAALTKTDDTNVTLTLGGSPTTALLNAASLTLGWAGTLAAARLNASVVHAITNDTNVTGAIATQVLTLGWTGQLAISRGGTGQSTAVAAFDALAPTTTLGDVVYHDGTDNVRLAGNITTAKQYLSQTGTGTISAAPVWATIVGTDITGAALTKGDDTNVTLTLGGTPGTALLRVASITAGWTGLLGLARGGTDANLSTTGGTSQVLQQASAGAAITVGQLAFSNISGVLAYTQLPTGSGSWDSGAGTTITVTRALTVSGLLTANGGITASTGNFSGTLGVLGAGLDPAVGMDMRGNLTTSGTQRGVFSDPTMSSAATVLGIGVSARVNTVAAAFTMSEARILHAFDAIIGAGSAITTQYGLYIDSLTAGAANYAIFTAGTTQSQFGGAVSMGALTATTGTFSGLLTASAGIRASDGSAAAPSFAFTTQTNTGLYYNASSFVGVAAGTITHRTLANEIRLASGATLTWATGDPTLTGSDVSLARSGTSLLLALGGVNRVRFLNPDMRLASDQTIAWASGDPNTTGGDTTLSRASAGVVSGPGLTLSGLLTAGAGINATLAGFVAGDRYVVMDASGNMHLSALGPAS